MLAVVMTFLIVVGILLVLVIGNIVFSLMAERKNPPIGSFMDCDGKFGFSRLDLSRADAA